MENKNKKSFSKKLGELILDSFFPIHCLGCKKNNEWVCKKCLEKICNQKIDQVCPVCEKAKTPIGRTCFACKRKTSLDGLFVCTPYKNRLVSKMIHSFKYKFVPGLCVPLGELMTEKILSAEIPLPDLIIPVPLHPKRLRWRGFNQSELLARFLSQNLTPGFEIRVFENLLQRTRNTASQMKIGNYQERGKNIANAFYAINGKDLQGKIVFLIDDVATTGSTVFECAKVLKKAGSKEVIAIVIARQEMGKK